MLSSLQSLSPRRAGGEIKELSEGDLNSRYIFSLAIIFISVSSLCIAPTVCRGCIYIVVCVDGSEVSFRVGLCLKMKIQKPESH